MHRLQVGEPFAADEDFWISTRASLAVLPAAIVTGLGIFLIGPIGSVAAALPLGLMVLAARTGRRSSRRARSAFADRRAWRDAERQAVGAVLFGARRPR